MRARSLVLLPVLLSGLLAAAARAEAPPSEVKPAEPPHEEFHEAAVPTGPAPTHVHEARPIEGEAHAAADAPNWQIGGGIGLGTAGIRTPVAIGTPTGGLGGLGGLSNLTTAPTAQVAVERRLGAQTWLGLGATVTFSHQSGDANLTGGGVSSPGTRMTTDGSSYGASVGIRQVVTPHEPVELSLTALVSVGYGYTLSDTTFSQGGFGQDSTQTTKVKLLGAGLGLGVAAEKPLTERLALRLTLDLLGLSYTKSAVDSFQSADPSTVTSTGGSGFAIGLEPSASLTLRFLF